MKNVVFANIPAEDLPEVSLRFNISAVPTVVVTITASEGAAPSVAGRVDGAKPADLTTLVKQIALKASLTSGFSSSPSTANPLDITERLKRLINSSPCILFMKGSPDSPKCGFSRTTVQLLAKYDAEYSTFDILTDNEVRQGLKSYSNWPTYPQVTAIYPFAVLKTCLKLIFQKLLLKNNAYRVISLL